MQPDDSMPSYVTMFDDPLTGPEDESRSVYSPAAYLADLLQLLGDEHGAAPAELLARRPDIERVPLDAANTSTELPYLEIVNEVLVQAVGEGGVRYAPGACAGDGRISMRRVRSTSKSWPETLVASPVCHRLA
jgi:hypothetical protein